jgi:RimJ/RimL family protein N-acetyltransferase
MAYTVRQTTREDWRDLRGLRLAALRDPVAEIAFYEEYADALRLGRTEWERRAGAPDRATFAGIDGDGQWCGMLGIFETGDVAYIVGVYLLPDHRGTGLARQLMRAAVRWAGHREVRLRVHQNNKRAARFYETLGFRPNGDSEADPRDPALRVHELTLAHPEDV